jgi:hypothetical protein
MSNSVDTGLCAAMSVLSSILETFPDGSHSTDWDAARVLKKRLSG